MAKLKQFCESNRIIDIYDNIISNASGSAPAEIAGALVVYVRKGGGKSTLMRKISREYDCKYHYAFEPEHIDEVGMIHDGANSNIVIIDSINYLMVVHARRSRSAAQSKGADPSVLDILKWLHLEGKQRGVLFVVVSNGMRFSDDPTYTDDYINFVEANTSVVAYAHDYITLESTVMFRGGNFTDFKGVEYADRNQYRLGEYLDSVSNKIVSYVPVAPVVTGLSGVVSGYSNCSVPMP